MVCTVGTAWVGAAARGLQRTVLPSALCSLLPRFLPHPQPQCAPGGSAPCPCPSSRGQSVHSGKRTPEGNEGCWGTGLKWRFRKRLGESLVLAPPRCPVPAAEAAGPVKRQEGLGKGSPPSELALISRPAFAEGLTCKGHGGPCSAT